MMKILVDADACPVVKIVERVAKQYEIECILLCDTNHVLYSDYSEVKIIGAGADAVDFTLLNLCKKGDIVVTQDYGVAAMILNVLRIYSIPCCFVGIAVGSIYQYVLGIRKLDVRDKGFALIITFVTILLICQVLPLVFAVVVNGWRG